jgi:hypothetical protein
MNILNEYPGPWSVSVRKLKGGGSRIELIDYNGSPVATIHGETEQQAMDIASLIKQVPEMIFEKSNS